MRSIYQGMLCKSVYCAARAYLSNQHSIHPLTHTHTTVPRKSHIEILIGISRDVVVYFGQKSNDNHSVFKCRSPFLFCFFFIIFFCFLSFFFSPEKQLWKLRKISYQVNKILWDSFSISFTEWWTHKAVIQRLLFGNKTNHPYYLFSCHLISRIEWNFGLELRISLARSLFLSFFLLSWFSLILLRFSSVLCVYWALHCYWR